MRSLALVLCACTGCDRLFDLHAIPIAPDARGSDAGADGGTASGGCSQMSMLADDFSTDDLQTMWPQTTALASDVVAVSNGRLLIQNLSADSTATLDPGRYYDLRGSSLSASITDDGNVDASDFILLELDSEIAGYGLSVLRNNATVTVTERTPQHSPVLIGTFPYVPAKTAYLRVGVMDGVLAVDASGDGLQWTPELTVADAGGFTFVHPFIQTYRGMTSAPFNVFIDDVNGGTPTGSACPIGRLHDDFSGTELGAGWARSPQYDGAIALANGRADVTTDGKSSVVVLGASTVYDVRDAAFFVELPVVLANAAQNTVALSVKTGGGDTITISETNGIVTSAAQLATSQQTTMLQPYDPVAMRWWRIQNSGGNTGWSFSPDGTTWTALPMTVQVTGIDRCDVGLAVLSNTGNPGDTQIDNVNAHP